VKHEGHPSSVEQLENAPIVRAGKRFVRWFTTGYHGLRVLTPCPIPADIRAGGAILVSNHVSSVDPVPLQAACPRLITWMMAKEYSNLFGFKWFLNAIEPILVERSGRDMAATRAALRALKDGKVLGIFPEGKIATTPQLLDFQVGVAMLAMKAGVPIYPAYLDGAQRGKGMLEAVFSPSPMTLAFGPPLYLKSTGHDRDGLEEATRKIRDAVAALARVNRQN
jgi:1-acyl-sn-glycerol-3-phosphate acyltransferase